LALAERIRLNPDWAGATILMLSSVDRSEHAARLRELGVSAYLVKPVKRSELLRAILTALGAAEAVRSAPENGAPAAGGHSLRILLAEDNAVNQRVAVRMLERDGHEVSVVADGAEAVAASECVRFDAILMDLQMPGMDGLEATRAIRRAEARTGAHVPIVAMTAHAMAGDRERCLAAGMDGYLTKPISLSELRAALSSIMKEAEPSCASPSPPITQGTF
jgi:CheY-like chemotaxis protein